MPVRDAAAAAGQAKAPRADIDGLVATTVVNDSHIKCSNSAALQCDAAGGDGLGPCSPAVHTNCGLVVRAAASPLQADDLCTYVLIAHLGFDSSNVPAVERATGVATPQLNQCGTTDSLATVVRVNGRIVSGAKCAAGRDDVAPGREVDHLGNARGFDAGKAAAIVGHTDPGRRAALQGDRATAVDRDALRACYRLLVEAGDIADAGAASAGERNATCADRDELAAFTADQGLVVAAARAGHHADGVGRDGLVADTIVVYEGKGTIAFRSRKQRRPSHDGHGSSR